MKLSEVFSQLTYGELSQMNMADPSTGSIKPEFAPQVVSHINLGLTALYKRFNLKENRVTITLQPGQSTYLLNSNEDTVFVESAESPEFIDDILKIERVYTQGNVELPLNDESDEYSCFTPSAMVLRVNPDVVNKTVDLPEYLLTDTLTVVYRANHPILPKPSASFNPSRINVELPYSHLEPLLLFVASRVNNPIGMTNEFHAGNSYAAKYEQACQQLEVQNLRVDQGKQNNRLQRNGWV